MHKYPELTPYQFASNTPVCAIDLDGEEAKVVTTTSYVGRNGTFFTSTATAIDNNRNPVNGGHFEVHKTITFIYQANTYSKIGQAEKIVSDNLVPDRAIVAPVTPTTVFFYMQRFNKFSFCSKRKCTSN